MRVAASSMITTAPLASASSIWFQAAFIRSCSSAVSARRKRKITTDGAESPEKELPIIEIVRDNAFPTAFSFREDSRVARSRHPKVRHMPPFVTLRR